MNNKTPSQYIRMYLIFHSFYTVISTYFTLNLAIKAGKPSYETLGTAPGHAFI
jgi:hypothetical protein